MEYVDLLGGWREANLDEFARGFFATAGVADFQERESTHYPEERYFKARLGAVDITLSLSDEDAFRDLPYWIHLARKSGGIEALQDVVDAIVRTKMLPAGFRFARIINFGKHGQSRVDYGESPATYALVPAAATDNAVTVAYAMMEREIRNVSIVTLKGKITIGSGDIQLREVIARCMSEGNKNILLDMSRVTMIDSSGIGELVGSFTTVTNRGGKLKLLHLPPKAIELLQITHLTTVFEVHDKEADAIASFGYDEQS